MSQSLRIRGDTGKELPTVYENFREKRIIFRRGQFVLIAAPPNSGKSAIALDYSLKASVPTLYFSADSDSFIQASRSIAMVTDIDMETAKRYALGLEEIPEDISKKVEGIPVRFNYKASPSITDLENSLGAFYELYGEYPALIVIDNITNVQTGLDNNSDDPFSGLEGFADYLNTMARETQACVVGLHHVTGPYNDANKPVPRSGVKGQITRVPAMVLTIHQAEGGETLRVSPVKNRGEKNDPTGEWFAELSFRADRMEITDAEEASPWETPASTPQHDGTSSSPW